MNDTVWGDGVWAAGVWAEGVWGAPGEGSAFDPFYFFMDAVRRRRR